MGPGRERAGLLAGRAPHRRADHGQLLAVRARLHPRDRDGDGGRRAPAAARAPVAPGGAARGRGGAPGDAVRDRRPRGGPGPAGRRPAGRLAAHLQFPVRARRGGHRVVRRPGPARAAPAARPVAVLLCALAWAVPVLVAASRLYRGMHHPTDVLAGALNGAAALWVVHRALPARARRTSAAPAAPAPAAPLRVALVYNPLSVDDALLHRLSAVLTAHGHRPPLLLPGEAEDCGRAAARRALADGARLVAACGGDGTVTACAEALAGTGATLAIVPCGTGNLLARNLGLPTDPEAALDAALAGRTRRIDLMRAEGDDLPARAAATMAGMGLDAAVMADTGRTLKRRLGWPAYVLAAARHLGDRHFTLTVAVDDAEPVRRQVRGAVVGNVGSLQGGVRLLPDAEPDDGLLDLVLVQPHGPSGWGRAVHALLTGTHRPGPAAPLEHFRGRRIALTAERAQPRECDGDPVGDGRTLTLTVRPDALLVRVPAAAPETAPGTAALAAPVHPAAGALAARREVA
ncbi:bifunctional phosphatase PAP2/diacylglycerol kinase family protein [Kitasatospora fiedleri]|uniref:bifunctional phosphatase PAP2/diacylglycerol kinase family protein n=1 Tax=Kitasatospora fiedleri TaxID=2991545 RepID=UPI002989FE82|nr:diacylglycerol kinase family protein [Kitasatospora fiedleri]